MFLKSLSLRNARNYARLELALGPGVNLFYGANAQGKTNLLEAVCYLGSLRSFRGARSSDIVTWDTDSASISGLVARGGVRAPGEGGRGDKGGTSLADRTGAGLSGPATRLAVGISSGKRRVTVDGKRPESAAGYLSALKVASFSPEDLFLAREYPSHRRRFLDRSIFHLFPGYLELANEYRRALVQLNAALKGAREGVGAGRRTDASVRDTDGGLDKSGSASGATAVVEAWEEVLAPLAAEISIKRREQAAALGERASAIFRAVLGGGELTVGYRPQVAGETAGELAKAYAEKMAARRPEARKRGHCTVGPHTEDMTLLLSGRDLKSSASRGQSRLALMALVLADCGLYADERGGYPVLLLDDVGSELDETRRAALMEYVAGMGQALMTATGRELAGPSGAQVFRVESNAVRPE